jgi:mRNA-degrading endonuclease toxin of MazEF toxin-antitoxin module
VNCDNLFTIPKAALGERRGALDPAALEQLGSALRIALDLDVPGPFTGPQQRG